MRRRFAATVCVAAFMALGTNVAVAGEITGNGKPAQGASHANSACAFSGQEDLQFVDGGSKGDPAHSQNFGHVKQDDPTVTGGANIVPSWDWGCNAHLYPQH